jgi:uncharacterized membrane protein HdeD (DUF308 family)
MTPNQSRLDIRTLDLETHTQWGWFVAFGIALLLAAMLAFSNLLATTVVTILFVGTMMTVGAVLQIIHAFRVKTWSGFFFWMLAAVLYGIAGITALENPLLAGATLTLLLAVALIAAGIIRAWLAFHIRPQEGWGWILASALLTALTGVMVAVNWPVDTLVLLGLVLAIDLTFQGVSAIAFGLALRHYRHI